MIRDPRRPSRDNYTGLVPIGRLGWRGVPAESMLEMDWLAVTNGFNLDLNELVAQPFRIRYWFDGKYRSWTPDFLMSVTTDSRSSLVEVKTLNALYPEDFERRAYIHAKWKAISAATIKAGCNFVLATEKEIRVQPRLDNARLMASVVHQHFPMHRLSAGIQAVLGLPNGSTVIDIERLLGGKRDGLDVAIYLAWKGLIKLAPDRRWDWHTKFVRTKRPL